MKKIFTIILVLFSTLSYSQSTTVVISQVYPGGGSSAAGVTYKNDYVELHNISAVTQDISGFSLQYGSSSGNFGNSANQIFAFPAATTIPSGAYLLIQLGAPGTAGANFPVVPDFSSTNLAMSAASGKVALVNTAVAVACGATATPCSIPSPTFIDVVSYGASNNAEGGVSVNNGVALPANTNGAVRKTNGCTETDNNNNDFDVVVNPVPRNSATAINTCGAAAPTLTATALATFGNVCTTTTSAANSFTISGSNLTTANVTVAALNGYTYSTTVGGTYTPTLSLPQPGGTYSQQIFVKLTPTAVQSYNGNIAVAGGGVTVPVNVAATGAGINSIPTVVSGAATAITQTTATVAGSIPSSGCTALTANYGIEYSTTSGFANGTGTPVLSTNLSGGNFSSALTGLVANTTYYYHAFASNAGGTGYGAELSFTTASLNPTINTTTLTGFGNTCTNTTAGPNSFTISGANLTTANVTVAALAGFTYSTTAGGVYTTTLSLVQGGGTYSQQIFVKFSPTAVQSYNGNIAVAGGGVAAAVNVVATGAGVNTAPSVTTGTPATAITQTTATAPGSIPAAGCTAVTAYGIEYSTTNGFPNGSGTPVASTNLAGGAFSSALSGLIPSTTYYYHAYATNGGGTAYGAQQSFTTASPTLTATSLTPFGSVCINTTAGPNSFTITGVGLSVANVTVGPLTGYTFAATSGGTYTASLTFTQPGGAFTQPVFVKFSPTLVQSYDGNIPVSGGGAATINVAATGSGANTLATVTTGAASNINNHSATLAGSITSIGCSAVTAYGIEFSGINGFLNGNGTKVSSNNLAGGNFSSSLTGLVQGATYYYKAYAVNSGGTSYGLQQSFTVTAIPQAFKLYPSPVDRGTDLRITMDSLITPGYYGLLFYNSAGQLVYQKDMNIQAYFINQTFMIPATLQPGIYRAYLVNYKETIGTRTILIQ